MWQYILHGDQCGPIDEQEARLLIAARKITVETLVWTEGLQNWIPAKESLLSRYFDGSPPPPPSRPSVPPPISSTSAGSPTSKSKPPFWRRTWVHVLLFIFLPFIQVPLMWYQKKGALSWRIVLSIIGFFATLNLLLPHERRGSSSYVRDEPSENQAAAGATEPTQFSQNISWEEVDEIYDLKSIHTDVQKREAWKQFKGKRVTWSGEVTEISDGWTGLTLQIKMDPDTFTSDLIIRLKKSEKEKALALSKGEQIRFSGTLETWGSILPISLEDGEIE